MHLQKSIKIEDKLIRCGMIGEEDVKHLYWEWGFSDRNAKCKRAMGFDLETFLRASNQISERERVLLGAGNGTVDIRHG